MQLQEVYYILYKHMKYGNKMCIDLIGVGILMRIKK